MPADPVLSRELKSLQKELTTTQRQRAVQSAGKFAGPAVQTASGAGIAVRSETDALARRLRERELQGQQIRQTKDTIASFVECPLNTAAENLLVPAALSILRGLRSKKGQG